VQEDYWVSLPEKGVFAIADGLGAGGGGQHAARIGCEASSAFLVRNSGDSDATLPFILRRYFTLEANMVFNALIHANRELGNHNRKLDISRRGGASVMTALVDRGYVALGSAGLCSARLYQGEGAPVLLNRPRSYRNLVHPGLEHSGYREAQSALGDIPMMALGFHEDFEPEILEFKVRQGDWLVLHTDGVSVETEKVILRARKEAAQGAAGEQVMSLLQSDLRRAVSPEDSLGVDNASILMVFF